MQQAESPGTHSQETNKKWWVYLKNIAYILLALLVFLFALDLMISSFQRLGKTAAETILLATSNPFTALFIGLLTTAIIQSSSTTTSMVVALVASGSLTLESAIPIIMGANIGTTITSTIVSLGFIAKKKEFIRAVSAGTYHDFFNILTVLVLFPFEYFYGLLSGISHQIAISFFDEPVQKISTSFFFFGRGFTSIIDFLITSINSGIILALISFGLLFGSILFFRKVLTDILGFDTQNTFQRFFFRSPLKSFGWGLVTTATIRSSTITTSLVVPLVAQKVVKLKEAVPFILGANIGTTITAFIAAIFNSNSAISIAIAHFLFNLFGVILFMIVPYVKDIPLKLAIQFGRITRKYRLAGFLYILVIFFFLPFSLIYLHKDRSKYTEVIYDKKIHTTEQHGTYSVIIQDGRRLSEFTWMYYDEVGGKIEPTQILSVYRRKNVLLIDNELYEFKHEGYCRTNEVRGQPYELCIDKIMPDFSIKNLQFDSVFVFRKFPITYNQQDSTTSFIYISPALNLVVKRERLDKKGVLIETDVLMSIESK